MPLYFDREVLLKASGRGITVRCDPGAEYAELRSAVVHGAELWFTPDYDRFVGLEASLRTGNVVDKPTTHFLIDLLGERVWYELRQLMRDGGEKLVTISQAMAEAIETAATHYMLAVGETTLPVG